VGDVTVNVGERRYRIEWASEGEVLVALEPTTDELRAAAPLLAAGYNDPHNRVMIASEHDYVAEDVVDHFASMAAEGARTFLLYRGADLAGDADFRHVQGGRAEFAILVVARAIQGKGLGTRFARMLHALAFRVLGIQRCYVTILPQNAASLRLFEKMGYREDTSPEARADVDDETDVSLSLAREDFEQAESARGDLLRAVQVVARGVR
jgi:RimJ/RimL family protein N-acetyltransferase